MFVIGKQSKVKLVGVHPNLIRVVELALTKTKQDFSVRDGLRTDAEQAQYLKDGHSTVKFSKHQKQKSGYGEAVDLLPVVKKGLNPYDDLNGFQHIRVAMFLAAKDLGVKIRWGGDWDGDGKTRAEGDKDERFIDLPHFEILL